MRYLKYFETKHSLKEYFLDGNKILRKEFDLPLDKGSKKDIGDWNIELLGNLLKFSYKKDELIELIIYDRDDIIKRDDKDKIEIYVNFNFAETQHRKKIKEKMDVEFDMKELLDNVVLFNENFNFEYLMSDCGLETPNNFRQGYYQTKSIKTLDNLYKYNKDMVKIKEKYSYLRDGKDMGLL